LTRLDPVPTRLVLHPLVISLLIALQFLFPKFPSGFRHPREGAVFVPMPKTAVDENDLPAGPEHEIGASRQIPSVEPVSIPHGEDKSTDK
jgi:hypothetical protein